MRHGFAARVSAHSIPRTSRHPQKFGQHTTSLLRRLPRPSRSLIVPIDNNTSMTTLLQNQGKRHETHTIARETTGNDPQERKTRTSDCPRIGSVPSRNLPLPKRGAGHTPGNGGKASNYLAIGVAKDVATKTPESAITGSGNHNRAFAKLRPSASSSFDFGVQPFQFSAGVVDFELPVHATLLGIGFLRPNADFCLQRFHVTDPPAA